MIKIYGKNCIKEAIRANNGIEKIFILDSNVNKEKSFIQLLDDKHIKYEIVNKNKMDNLFGKSHQGIGAYRNDYVVYDDSDRHCRRSAGQCEWRHSGFSHHCP